MPSLTSHNIGDAEYIQAILNTVIDGIITIDQRGIIISFNKSAQRIFGYSENEVVGKNVKILMPDPYYIEHDMYIRNYLEGGEKKIIGTGREVEAKRKDGTIFSMELGVGEITAGPERHFIGIIRDISDRKSAEEMLIESEARMRAIIDNTADGLITIDEDGRIQTFNKACRKIFGYEPDEVVGKNVKILMPNPYHREHDDYLRNYKNTGERKIIGIDREVRGRHKDGRTFPLDLSVSEMNVRGRKIYSGIVKDISRRKETEAELLSLGRILEESLSEIFIFDAETLQFIQVNRGARENMGYSMEELEELTPVDIKSELRNEDFKQIIKPLLEGKEEEIVFEATHKRKNGTYYDVEVHLQIVNYKGKAAFVANIDDTTERKLAQKKILQSNKELEQMAFIASHDLQEPVRMIANFTKLLEEDYGDKLDEKAREYIDFTVKSAGRMKVLIQDLLQYSRLNHSEEKPQLININQELKTILDQFRLSEEQPEAKFEIDDNLPEILMRPEHFGCLMQNLIGNSLKYRDKNRPPVIKIKCEDNERNWLFSVQDNGIGIKPEYLDKIFMIFKRLHSKDEYSGTGIGLALCSRIVERYKGQIWVESEFGEGSQFYFSIPKQPTIDIQEKGQHNENV
jgi:PAS domain S-box-containing protein